ncbi:MAG: hypothetical protein ACR2HQ_08300 [Ilumatobacteraceae bacterium]
MQIDAAWDRIEAAFAESISFEVLRRDVVVDGEHAICHIQAVAVARPTGASDPVEIPIRATEVLRRGADGHYRYAIDHGS